MRCPHPLTAFRPPEVETLEQLLAEEEEEREVRAWTCPACRREFETRGECTRAITCENARKR